MPKKTPIVHDGRDRFDRLICQWGDCGRPIGGITGLDEIHNMIAHIAEHHDETVSMTEALVLRVEWEHTEPVNAPA